MKNLTGHVGVWRHLISCSCPVHGGSKIFVLLLTGEARWIFDLLASKPRLDKELPVSWFHGGVCNLHACSNHIFDVARAGEKTKIFIFFLRVIQPRCFMVMMMV